MSAGPAARVVAQAKVNLALRILAREASGFHGLETLFCRLALGDLVTVRAQERQGRSLDCDADAGPVERNLAWRAAAAFQERAGWPRGFAIEIGKRIPIGGGLGGGSADAGAVLRILNDLAPRPLPEADLLALAMPLGSDVPFLTTTAPLALAWSRGERMLALPPLPARRVLLAVAGEGIATADAYRWLAESRGTFAPSPALADVGDATTWPGVAAMSVNDFEPVVFARAPRVEAAWRALGERAEGAVVRMSGSGATVFRADDGRAPEAGFRDALEREAGARLAVTATAPSVVPVERLD